MIRQLSNQHQYLNQTPFQHIIDQLDFVNFIAYIGYVSFNTSSLKIAYSSPCFVLGKLVNELPINAQLLQEGMHWGNIICHMCLFWTYIVWCKLPHLHGCWMNLWNVYTNVRIFLTQLCGYQNITWWESIHSYYSVHSYFTLLLTKDIFRRENDPSLSLFLILYI